MCDQSTVRNPHWHIRHMQSPIKSVHRVSPGLIQHTYYCHRSTTCNVALKHPSKKSGTTDYTVEQFEVCIGSRAPHSRTVLPRARQNLESICQGAIYSPGLPQDTKSLRRCECNRLEMLQKSHLVIKCHSEYVKVIRLLCTVPPIVNGGDWDALCVT